MKKSIIILFFFADTLIMLLIIAFFVPSIGGAVNFGRTFTNEFCVDCGSFRSGIYATLFTRSIALSHESLGQNSLKVLHDRFLPTCKEHRWCVFHLARGSVIYQGHSEPHPPAGYEPFKNFSKDSMQKFIDTRAELASQAASLVFAYFKNGRHAKSFTDLTAAINLDNETEITKTLSSMQSELAAADH